MSVFEDKKNVAEKKFVLEAEHEFKAEARRNKKLALWVSDLVGKSQDEAKAYITEVIMSDMEEAGDDDVFRKVKADLDGSNVDMSDLALREKMNALLKEAREEIAAELGLS